MDPAGPVEGGSHQGEDHRDQFRTYISEPDRDPQSWIDQAEARDAVYGNRRRIRGNRGKRLLRRRGERVERTFAHVYDTGRMRRTHLRGHDNILKRVLVHASAFNLGLVMRRLIGVGTPRGLQGRLAAVIGLLVGVWRTLTTVVDHPRTLWCDLDRPPDDVGMSASLSGGWFETGTCTTLLG